MDVSNYDSRSLSNASAILAREWSRHELEVAHGSPFRLQFQQRHLTADTSINAIAYGGAVHIRPSARDDVLLLKVPTAGQAVASYSTGDILIRPHDCGVIDVRNVNSVSCSEDFAGVVVRIRASRLKPYLRDGYGGTPLPRLIAWSSQGGSHMAPIIAFVRSLAATPSTLPEPVSACYEDAILTTLATAHCSDAECAASSNTLAPRHVRRAEDYVLTHLHMPLTVAELSRQAGTSIRALFDGFLAFRGTTPGAFIREARLLRARDELRDSEAGVGEVATCCGFRHAGNFAAIYRQRFGETPSDTRRFGRRRNA